MFHRSIDPLHRAFTLIELLVVITIIVVLLAILTPALDRAIYQAELAVCMANLRGTSTGVTTYAVSNKRYYPARPSLDTGYWNRPTNLSDSVVDDRPILKDFLSLKLLVDPFCETVDLDGSPEESHVFSSYNLWFGAVFVDESRTYAGMKRLGDRFGFQDRATQQNYRFGIIAGDADSIYEYDNYGAFTSHPDKDGKLISNSEEATNASNAGSAPVPAANSFGSDVYTLSRWEVFGDPQRGLMDEQFAYADGSVQRFEDIQWDDWKLDDARMYNLPVQTRGGAFGNSYPLYWDHIPLK